MTRTQSREHKMELLRYISEDEKMVTGCETGHDASVPFLHYFEGMLSLGPFRVPDSGRNMSVIWTNVPSPWPNSNWVMLTGCHSGNWYITTAWWLSGIGRLQ